MKHWPGSVSTPSELSPHASMVLWITPIWTIPAVVQLCWEAKHKVFRRRGKVTALLRSCCRCEASATASMFLSRRLSCFTKPCVSAARKCQRSTKYARQKQALTFSRNVGGRKLLRPEGSKQPLPGAVRPRSRDRNFTSQALKGRHSESQHHGRN